MEIDMSLDRTLLGRPLTCSRCRPEGAREPAATQGTGRPPGLALEATFCGVAELRPRGVYWVTGVFLTEPSGAFVALIT